MKFSVALMMLGCAAVWGADIHPLDVKPGQWETTTSMKMTGLPTLPPEVLKQIPPEQRAKVEAMMAARAGKPGSVISCITKENLQHEWRSGQDALKSCTTNVIKSTSSWQEIHVECNRRDMKTSGTVKVEAVDSEHIRGAVQMTAADASNTGQGPMNMNYTFTSKWVGPACTEK